MSSSSLHFLYTIYSQVMNFVNSGPILQGRSHWLGLSDFNLTTFIQLLQQRFSKFCSIANRFNHFVKDTIVF